MNRQQDVNTLFYKYSNKIKNKLSKLTATDEYYQKLILKNTKNPKDALTLCEMKLTHTRN